MVRKLPVIREPTDPDVVSRPRIQWILIGGLFAATAWVPIALVAMPLGAAVAAHVAGVPREALMEDGAGSDTTLSVVSRVGPPLAAYVIASAASGVLVHRFGHVRTVDSALSGLCGAVVVTALAWVLGPRLPPTALFSALLLLGAAGALGGYAGGALGGGKR